MKSATRRQQNKNAGFSLVELLVAVAILSIIMIPLLHMFLSSTRVNVKSRERLRATTLAQDVMEGLKAYSVDELKEQFENPIDGFYVIDEQLIKGSVREDVEREVAENDLDGDGKADPGVYYFVMSDVQMQGTACDALIKIDGRGYRDDYAAGSDYTEHEKVLDGTRKLNNDQISKISAVDLKKDAVFREDPLVRQRMLKEVNEYYYTKDGGDVTADGWLWYEDGWFLPDTLLSGAGGVSGERKITISITDSGSVDEEGNVIGQAAITYEHFNWMRGSEKYPDDGSKRYGVADEHGTALQDYIMTTTFTSGNVYLFYYPLYGNGKDSIVIENEINVPLRIYLVKQIDDTTAGELADFTMTDAQLNIAEAQKYHAEVDVTNAAKNCTVENTKIRTNLGFNIVNDAFLTGEGAIKKANNQVKFKLNNSFNNQMNIFDLAGIRNSDLGKAGGNDDITELIYDVTVTIYREGAAALAFDETSDEVVKMVTIQGSKNN